MILLDMVFHVFMLFFMLTVIYRLFGSQVESAIANDYVVGLVKTLGRSFPTIPLPGPLYDVWEAFAWNQEPGWTITNEFLFAITYIVTVSLACIWGVMCAFYCMRMPRRTIVNMIVHSCFVMTVVGIIEYLFFQYVVLTYHPVSSDDIQYYTMRNVLRLLDS